MPTGDGERTAPSPRQSPLQEIDLTLAAVAAFATVALALWTTGVPRMVLGLILALFLPGYLASVIAFPGQRQLDTLERTAVSFGLSVAITLLAGLALANTQVGLREVPAILLLAAIVLGESAIAYFRRRGSALGEEDAVRTQLGQKPSIVARPIGRAAGRSVLALGIGSVVVLLVVLLAQPVLLAQQSPPGQKFTTFYLVRSDGKVGDTELIVPPGAQASLRVGLHNLGKEAQSYRIDATIDGQQVGGVEQIRLAPGEQWEGDVRFRPTSSVPRQMVRLSLREAAESSPIQDLSLWIQVGAQGQAGAGTTGGGATALTTPTTP